MGSETVDFSPDPPRRGLKVNQNFLEDIDKKATDASGDKRSGSVD